MSPCQARAAPKNRDSALRADALAETQLGNRPHCGGMPLAVKAPLGKHEKHPPAVPWALGMAFDPHPDTLSGGGKKSYTTGIFIEAALAGASTTGVRTMRPIRRQRA